MIHPRRSIIMFVLALALVSLVLTACSGDEEKASPTPTLTPPALSVRDAWVRATVGEMAEGQQGDMGAMGGHDMGDMGSEESTGRVTGAFMVIENAGETADQLIGAAVSPEIARTVEIHETTVDENNVMQMRPVEAIEVPARGSVELKPGSYHIMLLDVQRDLNPGDTVTLTLSFASGASLQVDATVRPLE
ncbi:MAG: copper chaperone PCu(A)C [Aggregatilineaceae bacterium]